MKTQIHPTFYEDAVVTCICGNTFTTGSTRKELKTEICSVCHPFFTGTQRIVDTGGQGERFRKRAAKTRSEMPCPEGVAPEAGTVPKPTPKAEPFFYGRQPVIEGGMMPGKRDSAV